MRSMIDVVMGGALTNKIEDKAYNLIRERTLNNYQWWNRRTSSKKVWGKFDVDALAFYIAEMIAMTQWLERLNVNVVNAYASSLPCVIDVGLLTMQLWIVMLGVLLPNSLVIKLQISITCNLSRTMTPTLTPKVLVRRIILTYPIGVIIFPFLKPMLG